MHTYYACIYINLDGFCANCDKWKWARNFPIYHNNINFFCDKKSQDEFQKIKKFAQYFFACFEIPLFVNPFIDWPGVRSHYDNSAKNRRRRSKTCLTTCAPMFIWEKCISVQKNMHQHLSEINIKELEGHCQGRIIQPVHSWTQTLK